MTYLLKLLKWWSYQSLSSSFDCLVRSANKPYWSCGVAATLGLFQFNFMLGWRVKEMEEFPVHFHVRAFGRVPHMNAYSLLGIGGKFFRWGWAREFGIVPAVKLRD